MRITSPRCARSLAAIAFLCWAGSLSAQFTFAPLETVTDGAQPYQLSRNPNGTIAFDAGGTLHVTYWSGGAVTLPATPSYVYHREWTEAGGWSTAEDVDDSFFDTGSTLDKYGGRHPSLAIAPDGTVWIAWQDHRHSNPDPPGNGIDNIEIYADRKPPSGAFSATDLRLTTSSAAHLGDNGYLPRIASRGDGRVTVVWYDFNADGGVSDVYAKHSDLAGMFNLSETMASMRITDLNDRVPGLAYSIPDVAVGASGVCAAIWTSGFGGPAPVYLAEIGTTPGLVSESTVATNTGSFFDPAKVTFAPNGDLWLVYTLRTGAEEDVYAQRRPASSSMFDAAIPLKASPGVAESAADLEVDAAGMLHVVWVDERAGTHVYYGLFDPLAMSFVQETPITTAAATYRRATLALDAAGSPHLLFDVEHSPTSGDLLFVRPDTPSAARAWDLFE